jgi:hypothetical protein
LFAFFPPSEIPVFRSNRKPLFAFAFAALAASVTPSHLAAQAAAAPKADSMAFPRQAVKWFRAAQADSLFAHAGDQLKESLQSPTTAAATMAQMGTRFGEHKSNDAEVQFDEQGNKVFIAVSTYASAPEQVALVVRYAEGTRVMLGFSVMPLSRAKERFPAAKLP